MHSALVARNSFRSLSEMIGIDDELTAFEFDGACAYLVQNFDNKRGAAQLKVQLQGIAIILGADPKKMEQGDDEEPDEDDFV